MKIKKEVAIGIAIGAIAAACSIASTIIAVNNRPQEGGNGSDDNSVEKSDDVSAECELPKGWLRVRTLCKK